MPAEINWDAIADAVLAHRKATPGEWRTDPTGDVGDWLIGTAETGVCTTSDEGEHTETSQRDNGASIVASHNAMPSVEALLDYVAGLGCDNPKAVGEQGSLDPTDERDMQIFEAKYEDCSQCNPCLAKAAKRRVEG